MKLCLQLLILLCAAFAAFPAEYYVDASRPDVVYLRTPSEIEVMPSWNVATERGTWTGQWTQSDGVTKIGGTYLAQWRKANGEWFLQAELFVPTNCTGSSWCDKHPREP